MDKIKPQADALAALQRHARRLRLLLFAAAAVILALTAYAVRARLELGAAAAPQAYIEAAAPNSKIIEKIIEPLRYSGYQDFVRPEVSLDIDFEKREWSLRNIHRFDGQGNVMLNEGRYGVCEDLAAYAYQKILPHFPPDKYRVQFVEVVETSFFQDAANDTHIVLRIADLQAGRQDNQYSKVYILDPALRRYGSPEHFDDYQIVGPAPVLDFLASREPHSYFQVNSGPPIVINRRAFVSLQVSQEQGRFDRDHYRIVLTATRRYQFTGKPLFTIRKSGGRVSFEEKDFPVKKVIGRGVYAQLKKTVTHLHADFEKKLAKASPPAVSA